MREPMKLRSYGQRLLGIAALTLIASGLGGCWNGDVSNIRLADISLGQQLIDLQQALEEDAISQSEYDAAKDRMISLYAICESDEEDA